MEDNSALIEVKAISELNDEQAVALVNHGDPYPKPKPPQYTKREIGQMKRQFFTQRQGNVKACGHKFHPVNQPNSNCPDCWEAFFRVHEGMVSACESLIKAFGMPKLIDARGTKFVKQYKRYAAIIEEEQRNAASIATQETNA